MDIMLGRISTEAEELQEKDFPTVTFGFNAVHFHYFQ